MSSRAPWLPQSRWRSMRRALGFLVATALAAGVLGAPPDPRFPGAATTVAVNRADGRAVAVVGTRLLLLDSLDSEEVVKVLDLPGREQTVREFRGNTFVYTTRSVEGMPFVLVALHVDGRERLAWPNEGLSEYFPNRASRLTLDGRGLYGELVLDSEVREYFELPEDIPPGAGVAATYRFVGEKMSARASELFREVVALTPDDLLIAVKDGGALRFKAGDGVVWRYERAASPWRLVDVDETSKLLLALEDERVLRCLTVDRGELRWEIDLSGQHDAIRRALGMPEEPPAPVASARPARKRAKATPPPVVAPPPAVRVRDARLLRNGRVLLFGEKPRRFLLVLDPSLNRVVGDEVLSTLEVRGFEAVERYWLDEASDLSAAWEMPDRAGVSLLLRGSDGWYVVPVSARATDGRP